ncbi:hypothetical protein MTF65_26890 [Streptomyces sp. APSN-46.1]|uniref:hypothetical protein n=1 Tax=Streptomyces sp. APSN-46.1 TaxID=2929049 RepID=UPI001FB1C60B|nr:hypothetical protein [Streptomyces sp. APSN-46.1]MCJ1680909.1 hypothetical protein [Streptomyces sp. APSN-46.1]
MDAGEPGQVLASKGDIVFGVFNFFRIMVGDWLPDWVKWIIGGLVAVGCLWEGGKWLRRRRASVR